MAENESLSILLENSGKDLLAVEYGKVIDNLEKFTASGNLKNKELSGTPGAGSVCAKRFVNAACAEYGSARSSGEAAKISARSVSVPVDVNREILEEIEEKDVALYGVRDVIARRTASHGKSMARELERAFFSEAVNSGTRIDSAVFASLSPADSAELLIQKIETVSNSFVDGVERDMISLVLSCSEYSKLRSCLDALPCASVSAGDPEFALFHGVRVISSVYLPAGVSALAMADGAVAQPVFSSPAFPEKIPLSNALGFGLFFSYGTKAVMPDLIFFRKDDE